jgi:photosystem II stability/assembly factor-like uncharacterized protein
MAKAGLLFVGTDDGIALYSEPGAAGRWFRVGHELRGAAVDSVWTWIDDPTIVLATTGGALLRSTDGGANWIPLAGIPGGLLSSAKAAPALVTSLTPTGDVWQSHDAGATWVQIGALGYGAPHALLTLADQAETLYASAGRYLLHSQDQGANWQIIAIHAEPIDGLTGSLAAGVFACVGGALFHYNASGQQTAIGAANPSFRGPITLLSGRDPVLLAATNTSAIARSSDGGHTWELIEAGTEAGGATAIINVPYHMDSAFAGSNAIILTADRGRSWQRLKGDLPTVRAITAARLV